MKRKNIMTAVVAMVMTAAMSMTAFAGSWQQNTTGWWWQNDDGSYPANTWEWIDGDNDGTAECYYFDENGYMLVNTTTPDGYRVNANGAWVVSGGAWMPSDVIQMKQVGDGTDIKIGTANAVGAVGNAEVKNDIGNAGALLPGNAAVADGNFDIAAYGYENHISKLLFDTPFMSREELAELFGGERKTRDGDKGAYEVWYNGVNDENFSVFFSAEDNLGDLWMPTDMAFDFYQKGFKSPDIYDYLASAGTYIGQRRYATITAVNQMQYFSDGDEFGLWVEKNGKTLMIDCSDTIVLSRIVSVPGALR